jgi:hypothetical protein
MGLIQRVFGGRGSVNKPTEQEREDAIFHPQNAVVADAQTHSFVGRTGDYELVITQYVTGKNTWNYSLGEVFRFGVFVAGVRRNYSSFPFAMLSHSNGHDYLVCGSDYQGQTVIELDTGKRKDTLSPGAETGHGFCWAEIEEEAVPSEGDFLSVCGCTWGGEYEWISVDFADPFNMRWTHSEAKSPTTE